MSVKSVMTTVVKKVIELAPDKLMPGNTPDPISRHKHGLLGAPVSRIDGPLKVQGRAHFAADIPVHGMVYAALSFSTIAKGRIKTLDTSAAEAAPGVVLVMTYKNAPKLKPTPIFNSSPKARAPGELIGTFALECTVDELAEQMGIDPIAFRMRNEPEKDPTQGKPFSSRNLVQAYQAGAERFGWNKRNPTPGARREGEWLIGMGCATATYPYYRMPGGEARITLTQDGHATVDVAAHEMGVGTATVHAQVIAERMGLGLECVRVKYGDSSFSGSFLAGGSSQTVSIGAAMIAAHQELNKELLKLTGKNSPLHGLSVEEVENRDASLCKRDDPNRCESYASILWPTPTRRWVHAASERSA